MASVERFQIYTSSLANPRCFKIMSQAPEYNVIVVQNHHSEQHIELGMWILICLSAFLLMVLFRLFFNVSKRSVRLIHNCQWKLWLLLKHRTPLKLNLGTSEAQCFSHILAVCLGSTWREVSFLAQALNTYLYLRCDNHQHNRQPSF